jgi:hypothetical protein
LRVLSILVRHGIVKYATAESELDALYQRQLPDVDRELIVVDNAIDGGTLERRSGRTLIGGDNSSHEFSGFDRAIAHVGPRLWEFDFVQLATSAFQQPYSGYLPHISTLMLEAIRGRHAALGHLDYYQEPVEIRGYQSQYWMRTALFFLPVTEAGALHSFVSIGADGVFSGDPREPFAAGAPLDARYRQYLIDWLTGDGLGQGVVWHSKFPLNAETLPTFQHRARAIMNEHLLSLRLRALGCRLIDVTWLLAQLQTPGTRIDLDPDWRDQLRPSRVG